MDWFVFDADEIEYFSYFSLLVSYVERINPFSASPIFRKFIASWRDISRGLFFKEGFEVFFHINMKKM